MHIDRQATQRAAIGMNEQRHGLMHHYDLYVPLCTYALRNRLLLPCFANTILKKRLKFMQRSRSSLYKGIFFFVRLQQSK